MHQPTLTDDGARMSSERLEGRKKIRGSRGEQGGEGEGRRQEKSGFASELSLLQLELLFTESFCVLLLAAAVRVQYG